MPAIDVTKFHLGPGEVFVGGTAPLAGSDPNDPTAGTPSALAAATTGYAGVSTGGVYVGATFGPSTFTYRPTFYQVVTEQAFAEVLVVPTGEETSLACVVQQITYQNIHSALGQTKTRVAGSPVANVNYGGGLGNVSTSVITMYSKKRGTGPGYYLVCLYQGYSAEGAAVNFERRAETRLPVTLRGLADAARPQGDQLFQLIEYPADPA